MKIIELILDEEQDEIGVDAISIVESPAIESDFVALVESWIVESEQDKSRHYGLNVPVGTWMGSVKVNNSKIWKDYVKTNKVKGFSIEGYFADKMEQTKKLAKEDMEENISNEIINEIRNILNEEQK